MEIFTIFWGKSFNNFKGRSQPIFEGKVDRVLPSSLNELSGSITHLVPIELLDFSGVLSSGLWCLYLSVPLWPPRSPSSVCSPPTRRWSPSTGALSMERSTRWGLSHPPLTGELAGWCSGLCILLVFGRSWVLSWAVSKELEGVRRALRT